MRHLSLPQARCWTQLLLLLVCVAAGAMRPAAAATGAVARTVAAQAAQMRELSDASGTRRRASEFDDDDPGGIVTLPAGARVERDLAYGTDPAQRLDVYIPAGASRSPLIVLVHGGAWMIGDKSNAGLLANKITRWLPRGYVLVSVNYRLVPKANPLQQADDLARALALVQARASQWGADANRLVLMGHSAGAHLVMLLASDDDLLRAAGARRWQATVSLDSAAIDVVSAMQAPHYAFFDTVFAADPAFWAQASPLHRLKAAPLPTLLVCSSQREAACSANRQYASRAAALGGRIQVVPVSLSHREVNQELGLAGEYSDAVDRFLAQQGLP